MRGIIYIIYIKHSKITGKNLQILMEVEGGNLGTTYKTLFLSDRI